MQIKLHHLNLCSKDVPGMEDFYRSVLDLQSEPSLSDGRDTSQGYSAPVAFATDGRTRFIWPRPTSASASEPIGRQSA